MVDVIEELAERWKRSQDVPSTIQLCDALSTARTTLVQQVADFAQARYASNVPVLIAVARMYMRTNKLPEAQSILVAAGKVAPRDALVYRVLGEVLLRRGDAERAEKVFERAVQFGGGDDQTTTWLERARVFKPMQAKAGVRAVAAEVARTSPVEPPAPAFEEVETTIRPNPFASSPPPPLPPPLPPPPLPEAERKYPMNAPTADPFTLPQATAPDPPPVLVNGPPPPPIVEAQSAPAAKHEVKLAKPPDPFRPPAPQPGVPDARDVLDALSLAGVFESGPATTAMRWDRAAPTKRRGTIPLVVITVLLVGGGIGGFRYVHAQREKAHMEAEGLLNGIEADLRKGQVTSLPSMETQFSHVFDLDSRSQRLALDWLRERALSGLLRGGGDVAFEDGLTRARELKMSEDGLVFAQIASFLFQGDTVGAATLISKSDARCKDDAWYQLLAGATLERAGSGGAKERYAAAVKLDPDLVVAQIGLVRATAVDGDPVKAAELAKAFRAKFPDRAEGAALVSLAWARDPARGDQAPAEVAELAKVTDLPVSLRFVPGAVAALQAIDKHDVATAKGEIQKALLTVDSPGQASWLGIIALDTGDEALAQKAALTAVAFSAVYPPARVLAARVALLGNRLDEALKATEDLEATSPDVAVVRAATAYERVDPTALGNALDAIPSEARSFPFLAALNLGPQVLAGHAQLPADRVLDMSDDEAPWADLVAMDISLDAGDLATAAKIADKWKGSEARPLRALRLSRLARYQNRLDDADSLSEGAMIGTVTTRTLLERVLVLVARDKANVATQLLARYPLVLGPLAGWLGGYVSASAGKAEDAKGKTATLEPPPDAAPVTARVISAISLGAMKDRRRGTDYVKALVASGVANPDVMAAANALGLKVTPPPPVVEKKK